MPSNSLSLNGVGTSEVGGERTISSPTNHGIVQALDAAPGAKLNPGRDSRCGADVGNLNPKCSQCLTKIIEYGLGAVQI